MSLVYGLMRPCQYSAVIVRLNHPCRALVLSECMDMV